MLNPIISILNYLNFIELVLKVGNKLVTSSSQEKIEEEIGKQIYKLSREIDNMQRMLIFRGTLYLLTLVCAIVTRIFFIQSSISIFLISIIYLVLFIVIIKNIFTAFDTYRKNREIIKKYLPKYLEYKKGTSNQAAMKKIIYDVMDEKLENKINEKFKSKIANKIYDKFFKRSKYLQENKQKISDIIYAVIIYKVNSIIKKKIIIYAITFVFYLAIIFLSKELVIDAYYKGNYIATLAYPFKAIYGYIRDYIVTGLSV